MAAIYPPQQQQQSRQASAQIYPPPQGTNPGDMTIQADDPLFEALVKYVTTGYGAEHITDEELESRIAPIIAQPGGREYLQEIAASEDTFEAKRWRKSSPAPGNVTLTSGTFTLDFSFLNQGAKWSGTAKGIFTEFSGAVTGTVFWNDDDDLQPGPSQFMAYVRKKNILEVEFYRNGNLTCAFTYKPVIFRLPSKGISGSGTFA